MSDFFGGRDPFDDPFFTRPFGSFFGSAAANDPSRAHRSKGPVIQELDSDSMQILRDKDDTSGEGKSDDRYQENSWANRNPHVEHPDDQTDDHDQNRKQGQTSSVNFQRVTYGGINGPYYTASTTRRSGSDGMVLEESQQADSTTGQASHRISRGIHDKGHSVTRKLDSDGKLDTTQTLHNLDEDELAGFEQTWKGNADRLLPGWKDGFNFHANSVARDALPFGQNVGREVGFPGRDSQAHSARGRPKKVVTIPIE